jgi:putative FmdB family regulatory protein
MPNYNYQCRECDHTFDKSSSMDDRKIPETEPCPECGATGSIYQVIGAPMITRGHGTTRQFDSGFKEVLQKIDSRVPGSNLKDTSSQL